MEERVGRCLEMVPNPLVTHPPDGISPPLGGLFLCLAVACVRAFRVRAGLARDFYPIFSGVGGGTRSSAVCAPELGPRQTSPPGVGEGYCAHGRVRALCSPRLYSAH